MTAMPVPIVSQYGNVSILTAPDPLIDLDEAKRHLRVDFADDDMVIDAMVRACSATIEPPDSWIGRAFGLQTIEQRFDETVWATDCCTGRPGEIVLSYPPLAIDELTGLPLVTVRYLDADNVEQTLPVDAYRVLGVGSNQPARIALVYGGTWPAALADPEAVRVEYTAGYAPTNPQLEPAKSAVRLMLGWMYENREASLEEAMRGAVGALLHRYQVY